MEQVHETSSKSTRKPRRTKQEIALEKEKKELDKMFNILKTNQKMEQKTTMPTTQPKTEKPMKLEDRYVFSEKTLEILNIAFATNKNVILYGPGGHSGVKC